jgi:uncharacterized protein YbcC (UPF0753/DUF2309 family)
MSSPAPITTLAARPVSGELLAAIATSCDRIAPTWPLDQFIAVNPYWGWRSTPIEAAAGRLGVLAGAPLTMPRSWFREEWLAGRVSPDHLSSAAIESGDPLLADGALAVVSSEPAAEQLPLRRMALVTDLRDQGIEPMRGRTWTDLVVHQISQHCAAYFDEWQASWSPDRSTGLFGAWRLDPSVTHGFSWAQGSAWARDHLHTLPESALEAIATMLDDLAMERSGHEAYLTALLASVNGWAAWCAYRRWQARLVGSDDDAIVELLAIRLAWEWLLVADLPNDSNEGAVIGEWAASWTLVDEVAEQTVEAQRIDWLLQTAIERTFQDTIARHLPQASAPATAPDVQAAFCIDVRSEVFRRALEATTDAVQTRGFAGFFGLPIDYRSAGSELVRPQLPGLLSAGLHVTEAVSEDVAEARVERLHDHQRWDEFRHDPSSVFSFVESMGLVYGAELVMDSLPRRRPADGPSGGLDRAHPAGRPHLGLIDDDPTAAAAIGHRVLTAMGLLHELAPLVLLCGHGSTSTNNPHAAGLDCGACGGQTGEVNARVLADLLNAPAVRRGISTLGIDIPDSTWFVAALHDTTTDAVELFDTDHVPAGHRTSVDRLTSVLRTAGERSRAERATRLGLASLADDSSALERSIVERANDWSQVRPEWGLAGNAAFVVAPRWRTRHIDLQGRAFLHDYDWRLDPDLSVLTLIMTAPMVVTNWINLQYYASTVDHQRYGSGNKVLHNVVGGHIGVFEGNGGDLRIGLPMQSLHDGASLVHRPLRLSVFIEAPSESIDTVIATHEVVKDLVDGQWLHLLRIDPASGAVWRRMQHGWEHAEGPGVESV